MSRSRVALAFLLLVVVAAAAVWWLVPRGDDAKATDGVAVRTPGGALTFTIPRSWRTLDCPADEGDCVRVALPGMTQQESATVSFIDADPVEGTPVDLLVNPGVTVPGSTRLTVDGLPASRIDPDESQGQDAILVAGRARTQVGSTFMVLCPVGGEPVRARSMCDQILTTLRVTR